MKRPADDEAPTRVRKMRRFSTNAEQRLWSALRRRRLNGANFRRQVRLGRYVADFYGASAGLVVEADGGQHGEQHEYDERRRRWLEGKGFTVIRFWNNDVLENPEGVLAVIARALMLPPPCGRRAPPSPLRGERV